MFETEKITCQLSGSDKSERTVVTLEEENATQDLAQADITEKLSETPTAILYQTNSLEPVPLRTKGNTFITGFATDIGTKKDVNQDNCYIGINTLNSFYSINNWKFFKSL